MAEQNENYTYVTMVRDESEPMYTYARVEFGKIVSINQHWVNIDEFRKFFSPDTYFIDITGVTVDNEVPQVGDVIEFTNTGYQIKHYKSVWSLVEAKAEQIERLKLIRNEKELEPVEYNGHSYDADKDSLMRLDKARQSLEDNNLESIEWTTADNERVAVTITDFKGINTVIAVRSNMLHTRYNELKNFINGISDEKYTPVVFKIDWDFDTTTDLDSLLDTATIVGEEENPEIDTVSGAADPVQEVTEG